MILFKSAMVEKIRTCKCGHALVHHDPDTGCCMECPCCDWRGQKTQTRRFWKSPRVKVGSVHQVNTSYTKVLEQPLYATTEEEAQAEGFESWGHFIVYIRKIIGKRDLIAEGRRCYAVEFEVEVCPTLSL